MFDNKTESIELYMIKDLDKIRLQHPTDLIDAVQKFAVDNNLPRPVPQNNIYRTHSTTSSLYNIDNLSIKIGEMTLHIATVPELGTIAYGVSGKINDFDKEIFERYMEEILYARKRLPANFSDSDIQGILAQYNGHPKNGNGKNKLKPGQLEPTLEISSKV